LGAVGRDPFDDELVVVSVESQTDLPVITTASSIELSSS